ncbi:DUF5675 family protein [Campylobacter sp. 19-13652]|uniref:DUF5675 family protein n=1 Tax=Campylobacter sp. 19-13652 TaxID=2840180 RepID=UPI001C85FC4A|nr:DUF5675 family protein [Campylobacter sp. 19-13652]
MKLTITRFKEIDDGTIGKFKLLDDKGNVWLEGYTLEPAGDDTTKAGKDRRIPAGEYSIDWHNSPKFKRRLPRLSSALVPKSRQILIHAGNYPKDTTGCVLVGESYNNAGVFNSKAMLNRLLALMHKQDGVVVVENSFT